VLYRPRFIVSSHTLTGMMIRFTLQKDKTPTTNEPFPSKSGLIHKHVVKHFEQNYELAAHLFAPKKPNRQSPVGGQVMAKNEINKSITIPIQQQGWDGAVAKRRKFSLSTSLLSPQTKKNLDCTSTGLAPAVCVCVCVCERERAQ
jgi:hypothetical protein